MQSGNDQVGLLLSFIVSVVLIVGVVWGGAILWTELTRPTADQLYGCTVAQQAPNGECK